MSPEVARRTPRHSGATAAVRIDDAVHPRFAALERVAHTLDAGALCFLLGTAAFIYLEVFILPNIPVSIANDQSINLDNAVRMVHGQAIYRDFFQYTLPGTEWVYFALFKFFGIRAWIPNAALVVLATASAGLGIVISKPILKGWHAYLPALLFVYAFHFVLDATHHKYSVLFILAATAVLLGSRTLGRVACAGLLLGLAACFTQSRGVVAAGMFSLFLVWEGWRRGVGSRAIIQRAGALLGGFATVVGAVCGYFVLELGLSKFIAHMIVFPMKYYRADSVYNTWSALPTAASGFVHWYDAARLIFVLATYALIPAVYAVSAVALWAGRRISRGAEAEVRVALIATAGFALYGSVFYAPEFVRLCEASLPGFILGFWLLELMRPRDAWFAAFAVAVAIAMGASAVHTQTRWHGILETPLGRSAFLERDTYTRYAWVARHTHPWEFFFEAIYSDMYFGLGLRNPAEVPYVTANAYTRPAQVSSLVDALEAKRVKLVLWSKTLDVSNPPRPDDYLGPLRSYLQANFEPIKDFSGGYVVLERRTLPKGKSG